MTTPHCPNPLAAGVLRYQDTSTGHMVAQHRTKLGPCSVMRQNPHNAVLCLGHARGAVTMWTPNITTPVVKMLCHRGPVTALAVDAGGLHMVTAGADQQVWGLGTTTRALGRRALGSAGCCFGWMRGAGCWVVGCW